jgi:hypothetical protein
VKWISLILLVIAGCSYGQDTITKYIVIDTVTIAEGIRTDAYDYSDFLRKADNKFVAFENNYLSLEGHPSLCVKIRFLSAKDLAVSILLDDKMGSLELHNLENAGDTIRLSSYRIYRNCLFDSFKTSLSYYHHFNDTTKVSYKNKTGTELPVYACDTLREVFLRVNGRSYRVPISFSQVTIVANYCNG